jgi:hypothetical protein
MSVSKLCPHEAQCFSSGLSLALLKDRKIIPSDVGAQPTHENVFHDTLWPETVYQAQ